MARASLPPALTQPRPDGSNGTKSTTTGPATVASPSWMWNSVGSSIWFVSKPMTQMRPAGRLIRMTTAAARPDHGPGTAAGAQQRTEQPGEAVPVGIVLSCRRRPADGGRTAIRAAAAAVATRNRVPRMNALPLAGPL